MIDSIVGIKQRVAYHYGISVERLVGPERFKYVTRARHIAMWIVRRDCDASYPDIGQAFNRDHTTCLVAIRHIDKLLAEDPELRRVVESLRHHESRAERVAGEGQWIDVEEAS